MMDKNGRLWALPTALLVTALALTACERGTEPEAPQLDAPETTAPAVDPDREVTPSASAERGIVAPDAQESDLTEAQREALGEEQEAAGQMPAPGEQDAPVDSPYTDEDDGVDPSTESGMAPIPTRP